MHCAGHYGVMSKSRPGLVLVRALILKSSQIVPTTSSRLTGLDICFTDLSPRVVTEILAREVRFVDPLPQYSHTELPLTLSLLSRLGINFCVWRPHLQLVLFHAL